MRGPFPPRSTECRVRSFAVLAPYVLAYAGGVIGYLPLLGLLLPMEVEARVGPERVGVLALCAIGGAVAAGAGNILFGWLSDRSVARGGGRRRWLAGGLAGTALAYAALIAAASPAAIVAAVMLFQVAINAVLSPVAALMADEVPDGRKGVASGLLALGVPAASATSALLMASDLGAAGRLGTVPLLVAGLALPLLAVRSGETSPPSPSAADPPRRARARRDFALAWAARLLVQVAGNAVSLYLLYYFESVAPGTRAALAKSVSHLLLVASVVPVPAAILCGRWSDRTGRRRPVLFAAALVASMGLAVMASARGWTAGAWGFGCYQLGFVVFVSLHTGYAFELLPSVRHRGRDLGLVNLANTLPSLIGPPLAYALARSGGFGPLLLLLAALTTAGGALMMGVRGRG